MNTVGSNFKICVTCAKYEGANRKPYCGNFVHFDNSVGGKCYDTFVNGVSRPPMSSCPKWQLWTVLK